LEELENFRQTWEFELQTWKATSSLRKLRKLSNSCITIVATENELALLATKEDNEGAHEVEEDNKVSNNVDKDLSEKS